MKYNGRKNGEERKKERKKERTDLIFFKLIKKQ